MAQDIRRLVLNALRRAGVMEAYRVALNHGVDKDLILEIIAEMSYVEMARKLDPKFLRQSERVKELEQKGRPKFMGIEGKNTLLFNVRGLGGKYKQWIKFSDLDKFMKMSEMTPRQRFQLCLLDGEIHIKCDCPSFGYWGFKYIATKFRSIYGRGENRSPKIRNPDKRGVMCKHLAMVFKYLPRQEYFNKIVNNIVDKHDTDDLQTYKEGK